MSVRPCKIAILTWWAAPFHRATATEILRAVDERYGSSQYKTSVANMEHDVALLEKHIRKLLAERVEIFVPIGRTCSLATKAILESIGAHCAVITIGVYDPVFHGLAESLEKPGGFTTGIYTHPAPTGGIAKSLESFTPRIKSLLIPYKESGEAGLLKQHINAIREHLNSIGMIVRPIPLEYGSGFFKIIKEYANCVDGVLMLEGSGFADQLQQISYFCWEKKKMLCAAGNYAHEYGVAATYGAPLYLYGDAVCNVIKKIWEDQIPPSQIPITILPDQRKFTANESILRMIDFSDEDMETIKSNKTIEVIRKWTIAHGDY
jgi:ABC-type uncharacterized transport system substrate-binding protein